MFRDRLEVLRAPDGVGSSGDAPDPAQSGGAPTAAGGAAQVGAPAAPPPYRPEGLPDHLYGKSDRETIDHLFRAADGARKAISELGSLGDLPKAATDYAFNPSETVAPYLGDLSKDPVFGIVRESALKAGIRGRQFEAFLNPMLEAMVAGNFLDDPYDPGREQALLEPSISDPAERAKAVDRRIRDNADWLQGLEKKGMPKEAVASLESLLDRAAPIMAIEYFRRALGETMPALGGASGGAVGRSDLAARNADPRNDPRSPKFDRAYAQETERLYRTTIGSGKSA